MGIMRFRGMSLLGYVLGEGRECEESGVGLVGYLGRFVLLCFEPGVLVYAVLGTRMGRGER